jgi:hypothetical protein
MSHLLQNYISDDEDDDLDVDEEEERTNRHLRIASSNAGKAHSWRGDHPMKSAGGNNKLLFQQLQQQQHHHQPPRGHFFEHESKGAKDQLYSSPGEQSISMPFRYSCVTQSLDHASNVSLHRTTYTYGDDSNGYHSLASTVAAAAATTSSSTGRNLTKTNPTGVANGIKLVGMDK